MRIYENAPVLKVEGGGAGWTLSAAGHRIAAGKVIVFEGDDFIGMPINFASRLCDAAAPGEVLVSEEVVAQLDGDYTVVPLGELSRQGFDTLTRSRNQ